MNTQASHSIKKSLTTSQARKIARTIVAQDPSFEVVVKNSSLCPIGLESNNEPHFYSLATSILSQQLSTKAASTIIQRVETAAGGITPKKIASMKESRLRAAGASGAKVRSLTELSETFLDRKSPVHRLHTLNDEEIEEALLPLFGIGRWTIEMFLMFKLGRIDVWPVGDLGVRRGWEKIHRMRSEITPKKLDLLGEKFSPYRSHVAWYCWRGTELL
ncbi:MAG: DNA-3-methyladenine glycosylase 2 family protein [Actinobacteria bacterium]|nr:DNA-3-methyladenine glycosylase 2 family protein [Actinomycetota bacterium]